MSAMSDRSAIAEEILTRQVRHLLFWNRVWITLLCVGLLFGAGFAGLQTISNMNSRIRVTWYEERIHISSMRGMALVTHLVGFSDGTMVAARLPTPLFLLDSGGAKIEKREYAALKWRNEGGGEEEAPPVGSRIRGLYVRLEITD